MIHPYNTLIELINKTLIYIICQCLIPLPHSELYRLGDGGVAQRTLLWCAQQWSSSVVVTQPCWSWGAGVWIGWRHIRASLAESANFCTVQRMNSDFYLYLPTFSNILSNRLSISFSISFKYYFFIHYFFFLTTTHLPTFFY